MALCHYLIFRQFAYYKSTYDFKSKYRYHVNKDSSYRIKRFIKYNQSNYTILITFEIYGQWRPLILYKYGKYYPG